MPAIRHFREPHRQTAVGYNHTEIRCLTFYLLRYATLLYVLPAGQRDMTSPESKRAKGIRSPRQKKRSATGSDSLAMNPGHYKDPGTENLSQLSDIVSREGLSPSLRSARTMRLSSTSRSSLSNRQKPRRTMQGRQTCHLSQIYPCLRRLQVSSPTSR